MVVDNPHVLDWIRGAERELAAADARPG